MLLPMHESDQHVRTEFHGRKRKKKVITHSGLSLGSHPSNINWQYAHVAISSDSEVGVYFQPASASCCFHTRVRMLDKPRIAE